MHPKTPTLVAGASSRRRARRRLQILASAPSRIAHMLSITSWASSARAARAKPAGSSTPSTTSESAWFI